MIKIQGLTFIVIKIIHFKFVILVKAYICSSGLEQENRMAQNTTKENKIGYRKET